MWLVTFEIGVNVRDLFTEFSSEIDILGPYVSGIIFEKDAGFNEILFL